MEKLVFLIYILVKVTHSFRIADTVTGAFMKRGVTDLFLGIGQLLFCFSATKIISKKYKAYFDFL